MIHFYLFLLTFGLAMSLNFVLADMTDNASPSFEHPPKYLKSVIWQPKGEIKDDKELQRESLRITGEDGNRNLDEAINDFKQVIPLDDHIEMTVECFMGILLNWFVANDQDLNSQGIRTYVKHQKDLTHGKVEYGHPDIVIERSLYGRQNVMIIELKGMGNPWPQNFDWEKQLCSYLLGYKAKFDRTALGVISNLVSTRLYGCDLDVKKKTCKCWETVEFLLLGDGSTKNYGTFNVELWESFLTYLKFQFFTTGR